MSETNYGALLALKRRGVQMKGPEVEFEDARDAMEVALCSGIKSFAEWMAKNWTMTREQWVIAFKEKPPSDGDYFAAYNAGVESVLMAYKFFIDEYDRN